MLTKELCHDTSTLAGLARWVYEARLGLSNMLPHCYTPMNLLPDSAAFIHRHTSETTFPKYLMYVVPCVDEALRMISRKYCGMADAPGTATNLVASTNIIRQTHRLPTTWSTSLTLAGKVGAEN